MSDYVILKSLRGDAKLINFFLVEVLDAPSFDETKKVVGPNTSGLIYMLFLFGHQVNNPKNVYLAHIYN